MTSLRTLTVLMLLTTIVAAQTPTLSTTPLVAGCPVTLTLTGAPGATFVIAIDTGNGPTVVPGIGTVDLDLGPGFSILVDGLQNGLFLDGTGTFSTTFALPVIDPANLPATWYAQAVVFGPGAPALSNPLTATINGAAPASFTPAPSATPANDLLAEDVAFADLDNDGDLDAIVPHSGNAVSGMPYESKVYVNQGIAQGGTIGTFADETGMRFGVPVIGALSVATADVDNDGDIDIFLGADDLGGVNVANKLYLNQGGNQGGLLGFFVEDFAFPGGQYETQAATFTDVDNDGDMDLICGNGVDVSNTPQPNELFRNTGGVFAADGNFANATFNTASETDGVAAADVNGDGWVDLLITRDDVDQILLNNGAGDFAHAFAALPPVALNSTAGILEDFDGDGKVDVFVSNIGAPDQIFFGNGAGSFTTGTLPFPPTSVVHLDSAAGDVDNDGDVDIVVGMHAFGGGELSFMYVNQGGAQAGSEGTFVVELLVTSPSVIVQAVALGDVDNDGDLDLWCGSQGFFGPFAPDVLLLNTTCP